jgi:hypothetical protein
VVSVSIRVLARAGPCRPSEISWNRQPEARDVNVLTLGLNHDAGEGISGNMQAANWRGV